jgi:hypothetical protein
MYHFEQVHEEHSHHLSSENDRAKAASARLEAPVTQFRSIQDRQEKFSVAVYPQRTFCRRVGSVERCCICVVHVPLIQGTKTKTRGTMLHPLLYP